MTRQCPAAPAPALTSARITTSPAPGKAAAETRADAAAASDLEPAMPAPPPLRNETQAGEPEPGRQPRPGRGVRRQARHRKKLGLRSSDIDARILERIAGIRARTGGTTRDVLTQALDALDALLSRKEHAAPCQRRSGRRNRSSCETPDLFDTGQP